jgi:hypothetical protein
MIKAFARSACHSEDRGPDFDQTVGSGVIYAPDLNTIYSTSTGSATWTSTYPHGGVGAAAAGDVVFLSGARVVVQSQ